MDRNQRRATDSVSRRRPPSIDFAFLNPKNSMIYSFLPSVVRSRLPRRGSVHKPACTYGMDVEIRGENHGTERHPSEYASEIAIRPKESESDTTDLETYFDESLSGFRGIKAAQAHSSQNMPENQSGIDWKFANQGIHLLRISGEESATVAQNLTYGNPKLERQLYLDGLTYLLRGLPPDLTSDEKHRVQSSFTSFLDAGRNRVCSSEEARNASQPSILHKILASTIVQLFILSHFLLPYVKTCLRSAYEYERTHHISQKVLASSIDLADMFGKQSLAITTALYGMGNGKVGEILTELCRWVVEGVTGGIHDGIGEGLSIVSATKPATVESG